MTVPASPPTASTEPASRVIWSKWNGWFKISLLAFIAFAVYIFVILGRMSHGEGDAVPRPLNAIVLVGVSLVTVLAFLLGWRLECRARDFRKSQRRAVREAEETAWRAAVLLAIAELKNGRGESTVDLVRQGSRPEGRVVYASVAAVHGTELDAFGDSVARRVDASVSKIYDAVAGMLRDATEYIDGRVAEVDERFHDMSLLAQAQGGLGGAADGKVARLPFARN